MSIEERRRLGSAIGAHVRHSGTAAANTEPARVALWQRYLSQVDPDGVLEPAERDRRARHARTADMLRLARKSAQVRRQRRGHSVATDTSAPGGEE